MELKKPTTFEEQVELLKKKNIIVKDNISLIEIPTKERKIIWRNL